MRGQMASYDVPDVVVMRLPLYVRALGQLLLSGVEVISSLQLSRHLQMTPAQIRKDLSYFGKFGKQGHGYDIKLLHGELLKILGLNRTWTACLIGVGRLGAAIINYPGFVPEGFKILSAFDQDPKQIGTNVGGLIVQPISDLREILKNQEISIAIVAVPALEAQLVIDVLVKSGVGGILNYAPIVPLVPENIVIRNIDPVLSLQSMTFYFPDQTG